MVKQLALNIDGLRAGPLGGGPMDAAYMAGIEARARILARACAVKRVVPVRPRDPFLSRLQQHSSLEVKK